MASFWDTRKHLSIGASKRSELTPRRIVRSIAVWAFLQHEPWLECEGSARKQVAEAEPVFPQDLLPTENRTVPLKIGPSNTKEWSSSFSPHGSTNEGRSARKILVDDSAGELVLQKDC
jgi:hypothetical protein